MSRRWLVAVSVAAHLCLLTGVFITGVWRIERADPGRRRTLDIGVQPLPPPAPSGGSFIPKIEIIPKTPHVEVAKGPRQPTTKVEAKPADPGPQEPGPGSGAGSGSGDPHDTGTCTQNCDVGPPAAAVCGNGSVEIGEQCDDGNTRSGDGCSATCRLEPPPPVRPTIIHPGVMQGLRISGDTQIRPSEVTQNQMIRDDALHVEGVVELCITTSGNVGSTRLLRSTKYSAYDATLLEAVRSWRYQPYQLAGRAIPACSTVRFVYQITR